MNEEIKNQIKTNYEKVSGSVRENAPKIVEEAKSAGRKMDDYLSTPEKLGPLILEQILLVFIGVLSATVIAILGHIGLVLAFIFIVLSITRFVNIGKEREKRLINKKVIQLSAKTAVEVAYAAGVKKFGTDNITVVPSARAVVDEAIIDQPQTPVEEPAVIKQEPLEEHRFPGAFSAL